jgi:large subunit ribosomal protein L28
MSKVCQISGKRTRTGNNVSHANNKTKRKFYPNLKTKKFFLESEGVWVVLKVATSTIRTINKNGLEATIIKAALFYIIRLGFTLFKLKIQPFFVYDKFSKRNF